MCIPIQPALIPPIPSLSSFPFLPPNPSPIHIQSKQRRLVHAYDETRKYVCKKFKRHATSMQVPRRCPCSTEQEKKRVKSGQTPSLMLCREPKPISSKYDKRKKQSRTQGKVYVRYCSLAWKASWRKLVYATADRQMLKSDRDAK
jgi:hypothetical protein